MRLSRLAEKFNSASPGVLLDKLLRRTTLKRWRTLSSLSVSCNNRHAKLQVRKGTTDAEVVWQCFSARQYEVPVVIGAAPLHRNAVQAKYADIVQSGRKPLIVDCGANIGASTAWLKMMYPKATIVAIEPAPDNFAVLSANSVQFENVDSVQAGIGPIVTTAFLKDNGGGAWGYQTSSEQSSVKIEMISLASVLESEKYKDHQPFILKIDIEGAEQYLFERDSYESMHRFPVIIFESHDFYMPAKKTSSPFFRFHADMGRDFLFGMENVFSIDMNAVMEISPHRS